MAESICISSLDNKVFTENYNLYGPDIPLTYASSYKEALSRVITLNKICLIFSEDVLFREDGLFKKSFQEMFKDISEKSPDTIVYLGLGYKLPIHSIMCDPITKKITGLGVNDSMLRAQEKYHITETSSKYVGVIKESSMYNDHINNHHNDKGSKSFIIWPEIALNLDFNNHNHCTVPLMTYFDFQLMNKMI